MKLTRFRVTNFRSVKDSGWVDVDDVTALIGVNESGKTNLLLPLWKLNPAQDGEIHPTSDYPKSMFTDIRIAPEDYHFIEAEFDTGAADIAIAKAAATTPGIAASVRVRRYFNGNYAIEFPKYKQQATVNRKWLANELRRCAEAVDAARPLTSEKELQMTLSGGLNKIATKLPKAATIDIVQLRRMHNNVKKLIPAKPKKTSKLVPPVSQLADEISVKIRLCAAPTPGEQEEAVETVVKRLPPFVYYSNYGNLDSEIYLPHVVENLKRDDLGTKESAKARTLRVLFRFVRLKATEILALGREFQDTSGQGPRTNRRRACGHHGEEEDAINAAPVSQREADREIPRLVETRRLPLPVRSGREPLPDLGRR